MLMYFFNRLEAGRKLADELEQYRYENCIVLCLSPGGVLVGQAIAERLHSPLTMLTMEDIQLPGNNMAPVVGTVDQAGGFTRNNEFSPGHLEYFLTEFHQYIELEKMHKMHEINKAIGESGTIDRRNFTGHNVIVVNDGLVNGTSFDAAVAYLKPINTKKVIAAVPVVSVPAIDRLHVLTDEIHVLDVKANYYSTDHYYEDNFIPDQKEIQNIIANVVMRWS